MSNRSALDRRRGASWSSEAPPTALSRITSRQSSEKRRRAYFRTGSSNTYRSSEDDNEPLLSSPAVGSPEVGSPAPAPTTPRPTRRPSASSAASQRSAFGKVYDWRPHFGRKQPKKVAKEGLEKPKQPNVLDKPTTNKLSKFWRGLREQHDVEATPFDHHHEDERQENQGEVTPFGLYHDENYQFDQLGADPFAHPQNEDWQQQQHRGQSSSPLSDSYYEGQRLSPLLESPNSSRPASHTSVRTYTTEHRAMMDQYQSLGPRLQVEEAERKRRMESAQEMAAKVARNAERANKEVPAYEFLELIGRGAFGQVYKCRDKKTGNLVAVKITNVDEQDWANRNEDPEVTIADFKKEVSALQVLKDQNVSNVNVIHTAFDLHDQLWIVADYCTGGSVRTLMRPFQQGPGLAGIRGLPEEYIVPIARELAVAIKGLHDLNIVHRDIKCANVYITETGDIQLGDFGIVGTMEDPRDKRKTIAGTPHYMSPQMMFGPGEEQEFKGYGVEVDIWAYGCTLFEMATGAPPHFTTHMDYLAEKLKEEPPCLTDEDISEELRDLVNLCLTKDPDDRPNIDAVLQHPLLANSSQRYPTSKLIELIAKFKFWEHGGGSRASLWMPLGYQAREEDQIKRTIERDEEGDSERRDDDWNFSTSEAFDRRISQLPNLDGDLSYLQAPAGSGLPPSLPPLKTQDLSIADRIKQEHQERTAQRGENFLAPIFDISRPEGYQMTPVEEPKPAPASDLPLRNFTSGAPTRESMIEIDLDEADASGTATSTFALHMNALNENTIKPAGRRMVADEDDDDNYVYGQSNDNADKRATMDWSFPAPAQPKRGTMDWSFSTAEPAQPDEPEFSMDLPSAGFGGELAPGFRPGLKHTSTEPIGHFRDFSHDMRSAIASPDRSSLTSMIDLDLGLADPVPRVPDPADIPRPMTASSNAGSTMTDMTSGNPFDLEDDPIQNEKDHNRFSYHKHWQSEGGTMKRLSHKTMSMHSRGNSLSSTDSETALGSNGYHMPKSSLAFDIGQGLRFSDDTNQFPNFSTFGDFDASHGFLQPVTDVPRLGDPNFPLGPSLHGNGLSSRPHGTSDGSNEPPMGPEIDFPIIRPPHPDALAEDADPRLLSEELEHYLGNMALSLTSVQRALSEYANIDDGETMMNDESNHSGFESNREATDDESASDFPTSRRFRSRRPDTRSSPRLPQNESFS